MNDWLIIFILSLTQTNRDSYNCIGDKVAHRSVKRRCASVGKRWRIDRAACDSVTNKAIAGAAYRGKFPNTILEILLKPDIRYSCRIGRPIVYRGHSMAIGKYNADDPLASILRCKSLIDVSNVLIAGIQRIGVACSTQSPRESLITRY